MAEHKYESIKSINMALENNILQLRHQVEIGRSRQSRRRLITQQREDGSAGATALPAGFSSSAMPASVPGFSTSPSSPPSFSSISGENAHPFSIWISTFLVEIWYLWDATIQPVLHRNSACAVAYSVPLTGPLLDWPFLSLSIRSQYRTAVCVVSGGGQRGTQLLADDRDIGAGRSGRFAARKRQQQQRWPSSQSRYWPQR